jgi:predicted dehydrogenase
MTYEAVRLGVIGAGLAFHDLHLPALTKVADRIEIVAVATQSVESAERAAEAVAASGLPRPRAVAGSDELLTLSDVEAVLVAVPISLTATVVGKALAAGKHVLSEKPLADSLEAGVALIEQSRAKDLVLAVGENFRYQPDFEFARREIELGRIGIPVLYYLNDLHFTGPDAKYASTEWRKAGHHAGGYLLDGGTHIVAGMRSMVGSAIVEVTGLATAAHPEYLSNQPDTLLLNLRFSDGRIGHLALGYGVFDHESRHPKIYGTHGTLTMLRDRIEVWDENGARVLRERSGNQGFEAEWDDFVGAVRGEHRLRVDPRESLIDAAVISAGLRSWDARGPVDFVAFLGARGLDLSERDA